MPKEEGFYFLSGNSIITVIVIFTIIKLRLKDISPSGKEVIATSVSEEMIPLVDDSQHAVNMTVNSNMIIP